MVGFSSMTAAVPLDVASQQGVIASTHSLTIKARVPRDWPNDSLLCIDVT